MIENNGRRLGMAEDGSQKLQRIENDVRSTICDTYSSRNGLRREGRIAEDDFHELLNMLGKIRREERQSCSDIFEMVNPASDEERLRGNPGSGAMGAILEFRDLIRSRSRLDPTAGHQDRTAPAVGADERSAAREAGANANAYWSGETATSLIDAIADAALEAAAKVRAARATPPAPTGTEAGR